MALVGGEHEQHVEAQYRKVASVSIHSDVSKRTFTPLDLPNLASRTVANSGGWGGGCRLSPPSATPAAQPRPLTSAGPSPRSRSRSDCA